MGEGELGSPSPTSRLVKPYYAVAGLLVKVWCDWCDFKPG